MKKSILLFCFVFLIGVSGAMAQNTTVRGYKKPEICLKDNNRCFLKFLSNSKYWCLKSSLQRNLDTRRTTQPIRKTYRENMGHCTKVIPIYDEEE